MGTMGSSAVCKILLITITITAVLSSTGEAQNKVCKRACSFYYLQPCDLWCKGNGHPKGGNCFNSDTGGGGIANPPDLSGTCCCFL